MFKTAVKRWYPTNLEDSVVENLLLRLDEYKTNIVNVTTLDEFAGTESLQIKIAAYRRSQITQTPPGDSDHLPDISSLMPIPQSRTLSSLNKHLLVWIDDRPDNNTHLIKYAEQLSVAVLQLQSTAEAKVWIDENLGKLYHYNI
jgi:hypothetical protein